jgi:hypothetical protein
MGIRGEPEPPTNPAEGVVWRDISTFVDRPGSQTEYISVSRVRREQLNRHPWSLGGGGAAELKQRLDAIGETRLADIVDSIGFGAILAEDEAFLRPRLALEAAAVPNEHIRDFVTGEGVRDWSASSSTTAVFPYDHQIELVNVESIKRLLWPQRSVLWDRPDFSGQTYRERGRTYWEYHQIPKDRNRRGLNICFSKVATHNHFALVRTRPVFNSHASLVTLPSEAGEGDHLTIAALLNSSVACFWMKQVCSSKGLGGQGGGIKPEEWHRAYEFDGSKVAGFPLPGSDSRLGRFATALDGAANQDAIPPIDVLLRRPEGLREALRAASLDFERSMRRSIAIQEELDWLVYSLFGLAAYEEAQDGDLLEGITAEDRPCERIFKERLARGERSIFYEVHGYRGTSERKPLPSSMEELVSRRVAAIRNDPTLALIETTNFKRRWQVEAWQHRQDRVLRGWLIARLSAPALWPDAELTSISKLSDRMRRDVEFMQVAELYRGRADFDATGLVAELAESEAVPFLPVLRLRPSGLRKRTAWQRTWDLQRREDAGDPVGEVPVPPKYASSDYVDSSFWSLRGKLDVPRELFITYPHAERDGDQTPVVGWAGWDHLRQAKALAAYYVRMKDQEGWARERLQPLLAGLLELIPWLKQWHNDLDPAYGIGMGDYFAGFVDEETRALGFTLDDVRAWQPPAGNTRRRRRADV